MGVLIKKDKKIILGGTVLTSTSPGLGFINPLPTTAANLAGIPAGTTFPSAMTMQQMWDLLLYPYLHPSFSSFAITGISLLECGDPIIGPAVKFTWSFLNPTNVKPMTFSITDAVLGAIETNISTISPKAHNFAATPIVKNLTGSDLFTATAKDTETPALTISSTYTVNWNWRLYVGDQAGAGNLNGAQIQALALYNAVNSSIAGTYVFPAAATYKTFAVPVTWAQPISFKDAATGFNVPMQAFYAINNAAMDNTFGFRPAGGYNVYRTTNIIGGAINIIVGV